MATYQARPHLTDEAGRHDDRYYTEDEIVQKFDETDLEIATKASQSDLDALDLVVQGKADDSDLTAHVNDDANPHGVTATQVGLGNADNTADLDKPISTATQTALNLKADASVVTAHTSNTSNPHSVTKTQVGLSNVPNTDATARANHTGTQAISTVTGLQDALNGLALRPVRTESANYTIQNTDYTVRVDATSGPITITLPATTVGIVFEVTKIDAAANDVIVAADGTDVINVPGTGPEASVALESQFAFLILKCVVAN